MAVVRSGDIRRRNRRRRGERPDPGQAFGGEPDFRDASAPRQQGVRFQLEKGDEYEGALVHTGVRDGKAGLVDVLRSVAEQIDVDPSGPPSLGPHPAHGGLDVQAGVQEGPSAERGLDLYHGVEVVRLRRPDRIGLVDPGGPEDHDALFTAQPVHGLLEVRQAIAQV
jgi:hypothetical protein